MTGRSVVAVGVLLSLFLLMDQVAKCVARKLLLIFLQFSWRVSQFLFLACQWVNMIKLINCSLVLVQLELLHFLSVKCYHCDSGNSKCLPGKKDDRGELRACTEKDPVCYSRVKRSQVNTTNPSQEIGTSRWKGCIGRDAVSQGREGKDGYTLGCRWITETKDFCICDTDRCNVEENWPKRGEP